VIYQYSAIMYSVAWLVSDVIRIFICFLQCIFACFQQVYRRGPEAAQHVRMCAFSIALIGFFWHTGAHEPYYFGSDAHLWFSTIIFILGLGSFLYTMSLVMNAHYASAKMTKNLPSSTKYLLAAYGSIYVALVFIGTIGTMVTDHSYFSGVRHIAALLLIVASGIQFMYASNSLRIIVSTQTKEMMAMESEARNPKSGPLTAVHKADNILTASHPLHGNMHKSMSALGDGEKSAEVTPNNSIILQDSPRAKAFIRGDDAVRSSPRAGHRSKSDIKLCSRSLKKSRRKLLQDMQIKKRLALIAKLNRMTMTVGIVVVLFVILEIIIIIITFNEGYRSYRESTDEYAEKYSLSADILHYMTVLANFILLYYSYVPAQIAVRN